MGCLVEVTVLDADYARYVLGHSCWRDIPSGVLFDCLGQFRSHVPA